MSTCPASSSELLPAAGNCFYNICKMGGNYKFRSQCYLYFTGQHGYEFVHQDPRQGPLGPGTSIHGSNMGLFLALCYTGMGTKTSVVAQIHQQIQNSFQKKTGGHLQAPVSPGTLSAQASCKMCQTLWGTRETRMGTARVLDSRGQRLNP